MSQPARRPLIGITADVVDGSPLGPSGERGRVNSALTYALAVERAGGLPVVLAPLVERVGEYLAICDGVLITGGKDIDVSALPEGRGRAALHPRAECMHPRRQAFEFALLAALDAAPATPVLGICLGMQMMGVHRGAPLRQHLPDALATAWRHADDFAHPVRPGVEAAVSGPAGPAALVIEPGEAASNHHQALDAPGSLRVIARSDDGVIEAVDDPARAFYAGVQWHPERTAFGPLGVGVIGQLVAAAAARASAGRA